LPVDIRGAVFDVAVAYGPPANWNWIFKRYGKRKEGWRENEGGRESKNDGRGVRGTRKEAWGSRDRGSRREAGGKQEGSRRIAGEKQESKGAGKQEGEKEGEEGGRRGLIGTSGTWTRANLQRKSRGA
jgi:hypothetical protein